jgi:RND family efflux transporter MFP subunit
MRCHRGLAFAGLMLLTISGCWRREGECRLPTAVEVTTLKSEPIVSQFRFSATVQEHQRIELSFKVPGTVVSVQQVAGIAGQQRELQVGDTIAADPERPLARLDDGDYKRRVAAAQDRLASIEARRRAAAASATDAQAAYDRIKALRQRGSVAQQTYDNTLAKRDAADADLQAVQQEVNGARVALQQAEDDRKHCSLTLPIAKAVVSRKSIERGERVPAGQPVFEVMDISSLRAAFSVSDKQLSSFALGRPVTVMTDALPSESFTGRVAQIAPAADPRTRAFSVEVTVDDPKGLKPGMIVTITVGKHEDVILIPMTAVHCGVNENDFTVFILVDEAQRTIARKRSIKLNGVYDNCVRLRTERSSGVKPGDKIISGGAFRVTDGETVRVLDVPDLANQFDDN